MAQSLDFDVAFETLTGNRPFGWQKRIYNDWLSKGRIPDTVDIPTGLGKTSIMSIWLIARASGAILPRRLIYVVDRRAVVDQATRFAKQLRARISNDFATRLGIASMPEGLPISTLRGGFSDNRRWLENPLSPAIVVGTIDMIGSRLLFQGYGVSRSMRPYYAGFLGVDTLVLLDEAHLCPPFEALLRQVVIHRDKKFGADPREQSVTPPFRMTSLSATGRNSSQSNGETLFTINESDLEEPLVRQRLKADKRLSITELSDETILVKQMVNQIMDIAQNNPAARLVVYCNARKHAVEVKESIDSECKRRQKSGDFPDSWVSELLVGERRVYERSNLDEWLDDNGFYGDSGTRSSAPKFLVATSAGEVGVDLDADHMVCDLVAFERMVQRFGRVNRRGGNDRTAYIEVLAVPPPNTNDYEQDQKTYQIQRTPFDKLACVGDGRRAAGPYALLELKKCQPDVVSAATSSAPLHPELSRPLLDAWTMTSLAQHEGRPEVGPWLRGWVDDKPQTVVVWRKHLPSRTTGNAKAQPSYVTEFFRAAPIHATEKLEAPSSRVFDWLIKRTQRLYRSAESPPGDGELAAILLDQSSENREASLSFGKLKEIGTPASKLNANEVRDQTKFKRQWKEQLLPGNILVFDARIGGLRNGMLDHQSDTDVTTADEDSQWRQQKEVPYDATSRPQISFRVDPVSADENREGLPIAEPIGSWLYHKTFETQFSSNGVATHGLAVYKWEDDVVDEDSRSILEKPQSLAAHANETSMRAREWATLLDVSDDEIEALALAAHFHDDGKAASRWQDAMNAPRDGRPYAKTSGGVNWRLLERYRHEFGSLVRTEREKLPAGTRDLILHLIASHHGYARPVLGSQGCEDGPPSQLNAKAGEAAVRFVRMQKKLGPWGLAWRESVLRAADQSVSREWSARHRNKSSG